jgi:hypothetical protein
LALQSAEWLVAARVRLVDEQRRIACVVNAPEEARRNPPRTLSHHWLDAYHRGTNEVVGKFHPNRRRGTSTCAVLDKGQLALVKDDAAPSVIVRRSTNGSTNLLTTFEM